MLQIESLLSDFGGNIGLWIGFSAITVVEFIILGTDMLLYCCGDEPKRRRRYAANARARRKQKERDRRKLTRQQPQQFDQRPLSVQGNSAAPKNTQLIHMNRYTKCEPVKNLEAPRAKGDDLNPSSMSSAL